MSFTKITHATRIDDNSSGTQLSCNTGGNVDNSGKINLNAGELLVATVGWEATDTTASMLAATGLSWTAGTRVKQNDASQWSQAFYAIASQSVSNYVPRVDHAAAASYRGLIVSAYSAAGAISYDDELAETLSNITTATSSGTLAVSGSTGLLVVGGKIYSGAITSEGANFSPIVVNVGFHGAEYRAVSGSGDYSMSMVANNAAMWTMVGMSFSEASGTKDLAGAATGQAVGAGALTITQQLAVAAVGRAVGVGLLAVHKPLTGAAIGQAVGSAALTAFSQVWRVPTSAPNGTSVHLIVLSGSSPTYAVVAQGTAIVAGGYADMPATGSPGTKAFAFVHNYNDNTAATSIRGGPSIATLTTI